MKGILLALDLRKVTRKVPNYEVPGINNSNSGKWKIELFQSKELNRDFCYPTVKIVSLHFRSTGIWTCLFRNPILFCKYICPLKLHRNGFVFSLYIYKDLSFQKRKKLLNSLFGLLNSFFFWKLKSVYM